MPAVISDGGSQAQRVYIHDIDMFVNHLYDQAIRFDQTGCSGVIENVRVSNAELLAGGEIMLLDSGGAEPGWTVRNNIVRTSRDGIVIEAGDVYIHDNEFINCVNAITLQSGSNEIVIGPNTYRDVTTPITDSNTGTIYETLTTKGDLRGFDTANARIPVGTDTHTLIADSAEALGVKWGVPSGVGSVLTTKGDLHGFDTVDDRIPIGTNGQILTADSAQGLGLKWDDHGVWTTSAPTYTNITVGNGTVTSRYVEADGKVTWRFKLLFGSTTTVDGSGVTVSLPVNAATGGASTDGPFVGQAAMFESGNVVFVGMVTIDSATFVFVGPTFDSGSWERLANLSATQPFTWGTSDELSFQITYEAA